MLYFIYELVRINKLMKPTKDGFRDPVFIFKFLEMNPNLLNMCNRCKVIQFDFETFFNTLT